MSKIIAVYLRITDIECWCHSFVNIEKLSHEFPDYQVCAADTEEEFLRILSDAEIAVSWKFTDEWVDRFPELKLIATPAAGDDWMPATPKEHLKIVHGAFHGQIMSETAVGLVLAHARQLYKADYMMKHGCVWPRVELDSCMRSIRKSHVAILGFGSIGMMIAEKLKVFGCRITGIKQSLCDKPNFFSDGDALITIKDFKGVLSDVDHLISVLPATATTDNIINKEVLAELPATAAVYNLGRGNAVNEDDLLAALDDHEIAAAYLDVFKTEPLSEDSVLRDTDNLYIYPHSSAITPEYLDLYFEELPAQIRAALSL